MKLSRLFGEWERIRREMIDAVRPLIIEQLNWLPDGGLSSIGDLLRHIAETETWWFGNVILKKDNYRDLTRETAPDLDTIIKELEKSH